MKKYLTQKRISQIVEMYKGLEDYLTCHGSEDVETYESLVEKHSWDTVAICREFCKIVGLSRHEMVCDIDEQYIAYCVLREATERH